MKTNKLLLSCLFFTQLLIAQVSVSPRITGPLTEFSQEELEAFKKTETIFVLPTHISQEEYETVLSKVWTITPYKLVDYKDFDLSNYANGNYSVVEIKKRDLKSMSYYYALELYMFINDISEELSGISNKFSSKYERLVEKNTLPVASVMLVEKLSSMVDLVMSGRADKLDDETLREIFYAEDFFYNFHIGLLSNYLQLINSKLTAGKGYWIYGNDNSQDLALLKESTLYIPQYILDDYEDNKKMSVGEKDIAFEEIIEAYKFPFEVIGDEALDKKILNQEKIFYLRFARMSYQKFITVVDASTGEEIYRKYIPGAKSKKNIQERQLENLSVLIGESN